MASNVVSALCFVVARGRGWIFGSSALFSRSRDELARIVRNAASRPSAAFYGVSQICNAQCNYCLLSRTLLRLQQNCRCQQQLQKVTTATIDAALLCCTDAARCVVRTTSGQKFVNYLAGFFTHGKPLARPRICVCRIVSRPPQQTNLRAANMRVLRGNLANTPSRRGTATTPRTVKTDHVSLSKITVYCITAIEP